MSVFRIIEKIAEEKNGIIRTRDIVNAGISKPTFSKFVKEKGYERVAKGIYLSPDVWEDPFYIYQLQSPRIIYSHDTALYLLDMTDVAPNDYTVTVNSGYNMRHLQDKKIKAFYVKQDIYELGITEAQTPFGNTVRCYDLERTVCDIVRSRNQLEIRFFTETLKRYVKSRRKDLSKLKEYGEKLKVYNLISDYLKVLL